MFDIKGELGAPTLKANLELTVLDLFQKRDFERTLSSALVTFKLLSVNALNSISGVMLLKKSEKSNFNIY